MPSSSSNPPVPLTTDDLARPTLPRVRALLAADRPVEADLLLRACDRLAPEDPAALPLRVQVASVRQDPVRLVDAIRAQLKVTPAQPGLRLALTRALYRLGRLEEGLEAVESMRVPPSHRLAPEARWWHARLLIRAARFAEARSVIDAMTAKPGEEALASTLRGEVEMLEGELDVARETLTEVVENDTAPIRARREGGFLLARVLDRTDRADEAFLVAARGHTLRSTSFDADAWDRAADDLISRYDASWFDRAPRATITDRSPVLLVGLPRSGTSLLEQIIASHPRAAGVGERQDPFRIQEDLETLDDLGPERPSPDDLDRLSEAYLGMQRRCNAEHDRVVNKALGLERVLGWTSRALPGMRVIRIDRDPRDTLLSIHQHGLSPVVHPWAASLEDLVRVHATFTRLMDHWQAVLPVPVLAIRYESLVNEPQAAIDRVLEFLELDPEPRCLRFHENERTVLTPSHDQVRRPLNRDGLGRWRRYERHLGPLLDAFPPTSADDRTDTP